MNKLNEEDDFDKICTQGISLEWDYSKSKTEEEIEEQAGPIFTPQLYIQRYQTVAKILTRSEFQKKIKKVIDFGCAECKLFYHLKTLPGVEEILHVDADELTLERARFNVAPRTFDFLCKRETPLSVRLLSGSIAEMDPALQGTQAVVCIELIEHLRADDLSKIAGTLFGLIHPLVVIITTPNYEFNVLFPSLEGKLRHWDHKFEWTRHQFELWCSEVLNKYPCYTVEMTGVGNPTPDHQHLGFCTQIAIFTHGEMCHHVNPTTELVPKYKVVAEYTYPWKVVTSLTDYEKSLEVEYYLRFLSVRTDESEDDGDVTEIPISIPLLRAFPKLAIIFPKNEELKQFLIDHGYSTFMKNGDWCVKYRLPEKSDSDQDDDDDDEEEERSHCSEEENREIEELRKEIGELSDMMADTLKNDNI